MPCGRVRATEIAAARASHGFKRWIFQGKRGWSAGRACRGPGHADGAGGGNRASERRESSEAVVIRAPQGDDASRAMLRAGAAIRYGPSQGCGAARPLLRQEAAGRGCSPLRIGKARRRGASPVEGARRPRPRSERAVAEPARPPPGQKRVRRDGFVQTAAGATEALTTPERVQTGQEASWASVPVCLGGGLKGPSFAIRPIRAGYFPSALSSGRDCPGRNFFAAWATLLASTGGLC